MRSVFLFSFVMIVGSTLAANSSTNAGNDANNAHIIEIIASILAPWISRPPAQPTNNPAVNEGLSSHQNQTSSESNANNTVPEDRFYFPIVTAALSAQNISGNVTNASPSFNNNVQEFYNSFNANNTVTEARFYTPFVSAGLSAQNTSGSVTNASPDFNNNFQDFYNSFNAKNQTST